MGRPVGVDVVQLERLDLAPDRRPDRHGDERPEEELRRSEIAPDRAQPRPEIGPRPAAEPVDLGAEDGPRHEAEVVGPRDEVSGPGLDDRLALETEREDLDVVAEPLELQDLVEDERLGRLREPRHQVGEPERARPGRRRGDRPVSGRALRHRGRPALARSAYSPA